MKFLEQVSIKSRLLILLTIWIAAFAGFGAFTITRMNQIEEITHNIHEKSMSVSNAAIEARVDIIKIHRTMKDLIFMESLNEATIAVHEISRLHDNIIKNLDIIHTNAISEESHILETEARELMLNWYNEIQSVFKVLFLGNYAEAAQISASFRANYVDNLDSLLQEIDSNAKQEALNYINQAGSIEKKQRSTILTMLAILSVTFIIAFILIIRSILRPIDALKSVMDAASSCGELTEAYIPGNNEISSMVDNYNILINKLRDTFWIKDGQNKLSQQLSGSQDFNELTNNALSFITRFTNSGKGVLYLFDEGEKKLRLSASCTLIDKDAPFGKKYTIPLFFESELYGVLELSSFEPFDASKQSFLEEAAKIISINLHSALKSEKIVRLLEESESARHEADRLTKELQKANTELKEQKALLNLQKHNLEKAQQELMCYAKKLEDSNNCKSEFLANISHELRTPLNSIILLSKLLAKQEKSDEDEKSKAEIIYNAAQELLRLINDLLDLSKIECGKITLCVERFSTAKLACELEEMFRSVADEQNLKFEVIDNIKDCLVGDKDKISQILRNFLSNAFKFTKEGKVVLEFSENSEDSSYVAFSVSDTGIGIEKDKLKHIFEAFWQVDREISRKYGGTGLGLYISDKLAKLMEGNISVASIPSAGSTFTLHIKKNLAFRNGTAEGKTAPMPEEKNAKTDNSNILILTRDRLLSDKLKKALQRMDWRTIAAESGASGLEYIRTREVCGIILDFELSDMAGTDFLKSLKSDDRLSGIPVHIIDAADKEKILLNVEAVMDGIALFLKNTSGQDKPKYYLSPKTSIDIDLDLTGKKILITDDDTRNIFVLASALEEYGAEIISAENGSVALEKLENHQIDLVLMDMMMPVMDGYQAIQAIRSHKKFCSIPIIALTAKALIDDRAKCITAGANGYVSKPVDLDMLLRLIKTWINYREPLPSS